MLKVTITHKQLWQLIKTGKVENIALEEYGVVNGQEITVYDGEEEKYLKIKVMLTC